MIVLDATMALAWHFKRTDPPEALLAQQALKAVNQEGAIVPGFWYSEIANGLLHAERHSVTSPGSVAAFQADLSQLEIAIDSALPETTMSLVLSLGRSWKLSGHDATYLELTIRSGGRLATFDRQLAATVRNANGWVFGDRA